MIFHNILHDRQKYKFFKYQNCLYILHKHYDIMLQSLIAEFEYEVNKTRRLLQAIPEKDLGYKPSSISWTMGELAQHIATIYYWYVGTLTKDVYDMATD